MVAASYVIDALILLIYAHAGDIPATDRPGLRRLRRWSPSPSISCCRKSGFTERFKDHYFVAPQSIVSMAIMLAFTYIAPEVGVRVSLHAVRRVQLRLAALDAAANRHGLDRDGARPRRAVSVDRQADLDAARQLSGALRDHVGVRPDHRALHVSRHVLQLDAPVALHQRPQAQGSLQADRRTRRTRRTDRLLQPPLHHADAG